MLQGNHSKHPQPVCSFPGLMGLAPSILLFFWAKSLAQEVFGLPEPATKTRDQPAQRLALMLPFTLATT